MYVAKAGGRNKAVLLDEKMRADLDERSRMELMLRDALEQGELRLHYQPEVDLAQRPLALGRGARSLAAPHEGSR